MNRLILILILMVSIGATLNWNTTYYYTVIDGTATYSYRPPTDLEVKEKKLNEEVDIELMKHIKKGQSWQKAKGRSYPYRPPKGLRKKIKMDIANSTTYYSEIAVLLSSGTKSTSGEGGFINPLLAIIIVAIGILGIIIFKKRRKK